MRATFGVAVSKGSVLITRQYKAGQTLIGGAWSTARDQALRPPPPAATALFRAPRPLPVHSLVIAPAIFLPSRGLNPGSTPAHAVVNGHRRRWLPRGQSGIPGCTSQYGGAHEQPD